MVCDRWLLKRISRPPPKSTFTWMSWVEEVEEVMLLVVVVVETNGEGDAVDTNIKFPRSPQRWIFRA